MAKTYNKTVIEADDGNRRVIVTVECIDDSSSLVREEFKTFHKSATDRVMEAMRGIRFFHPFLSDIRARNRR